MIQFGVSEGIGLRDTMDDAYAIRNIPKDKFFSAEVYDGHINSLAAKVASNILTQYFLDSRFNEINKNTNKRNLEINLLRNAYLSTDTFIQKHGILSGAVAATFFLIEDRFLAANVGDARIILGTSNGLRVLTKDHKPDILEEKIRIEMLGGQITTFNVPRVQGQLAISRALGDFRFRPYVIAEPRILEGRLGRENDYAIVACDGVWDTLRPKEALGIARDAKNPQLGAELIKLKAYENGSTDNITVIVISLLGISDILKHEKMEIHKVMDFGRCNRKIILYDKIKP